MSDMKAEPRACDEAITLAFSVLGKRWNGMILGVLGSGSASFVGLRKAVRGISDTVLSERLSGLAEAGLVRRVVAEGPPVSVTYELTAAGADIVPAIQALAAWATRNLQPLP
ncbi:winged helix-turn-helix transcriptional regulator [Microbacterium terrisoli]|uniref:winged helix-turn-helix transcriptional regulator n=1 Tax=Microbacterium terrisoli TaxID=3242192 RepID=UPI002803DD07|nr:helix-turn-helix domain-containing protein [Microbacterium protaetiae]